VRNVLRKALLVCLGAASLLAGCGEDVSRVDARLSTPEHTVQTLLASHGLDALTQEEITARIVERGAFDLEDADAWAACFVDLERPGGEGMAGYVLGLLAAGREQLRYEAAGQRAYVYPREGVRVVLVRGDDGGYRVSLQQSVPEDVRRGLLRIEERQGERGASASPVSPGSSLRPR
jgi:hypothetical protein